MIIDRKQRLLRKNHTSSKPSRMLFIDSETQPSRKGKVEYHKMRMAWTLFWQPRQGKLSDTERWEFFSKSYPLMKYIESLCHSKTTLYVFAHNAFFDLQASEFFYWFPKWGWKLDFHYDKGLTYILVIRRGKETIKVISTTNYFKATVEELGELIGLEKLKGDPLKMAYSDLKRYCRRDVEIIYQAMRYYLDFIKEHDLGRFSMTKSSQAFNAYRHRFMAHKIWIHESDPVKLLERSAYMGGRVECFKLGKIEGGPFVSLDVNSMYPYIMKKVDLPYKLRDYQENVSLKAAKEILKNRCVVAEITVKTDVPAYPIRRDKKVIFPIGEFRCFVNTPGLKFAFDRKHLKKIHSLASYEKANLFTEYVDFFYNLKVKYGRENNPIMQTLSKYLLNTLYGKFGQKLSYETKEESVEGDEYYRIETWDMVTGEREITYKMFNTLVTLQGEGEGRNSLVAIASHITEHARFYLWNIMEKVGTENVLYCDTDSIKIEAKYKGRVDYMSDPEKLGDLKVDEEFKTLNLWGLKSYETEKTRKLKGVPQKAEVIGPMHFRYPSFLGQASHMREGLSRHYKVVYVDKVIRGVYDKGIVHPDGSITPLLLPTPQKLSEPPPVALPFS